MTEDKPDDEVIHCYEQLSIGAKKALMKYPVTRDFTPSFNADHSFNSFKKLYEQDILKLASYKGNEGKHPWECKNHFTSFGLDVREYALERAMEKKIKSKRRVTSGTIKISFNKRDSKL